MGLVYDEGIRHDNETEPITRQRYITLHLQVHSKTTATTLQHQ